MASIGEFSDNFRAITISLDRYNELLWKEADFHTIKELIKNKHIKREDVLSAFGETAESPIISEGEVD